MRCREVCGQSTFLKREALLRWLAAQAEETWNQNNLGRRNLQLGAGSCARLFLRGRCPCAQDVAAVHLLELI